MKLAIGLANKAREKGEVPVGALIIQEKNPKTGDLLEKPLVVAKAHNTRESQRNPLGHAEALAIQKASKKLGRWRLTGCTLYVTLEPCLMCAGAIVLARLDRVVFGAYDPKAGAVSSLYQVLEDIRLNHRPEVAGGLLEVECSRLLTEFFKDKRQLKKSLS